MFPIRSSATLPPAMLPTDATHARTMLMPALCDLGLSLEIRCSCQGATVVGIRLMLARRPALAKRSLGWVVDRLRCGEKCRGRPSYVALLDAQEHACWAGHKRGRPRPWAAVLVGACDDDEAETETAAPLPGRRQ